MGHHRMCPLAYHPSPCDHPYQQNRHYHSNQRQGIVRNPVTSPVVHDGLPSAHNQVLLNRVHHNHLYPPKRHRQQHGSMMTTIMRMMMTISMMTMRRTIMSMMMKRMTMMSSMMMMIMRRTMARRTMPAFPRLIKPNKRSRRRNKRLNNKLRPRRPDS